MPLLKHAFNVKCSIYKQHIIGKILILYFTIEIITISSEDEHGS
jgi:hypothetical protein